MKKIFTVLALISIAASGIYSESLENYDNKALIDKYGLFDGFYYQTKNGNEKLSYSIFLGPSLNLKNTLLESEQSRVLFPKIDDKLVLGNLVFWGSIALVPADIVFLANYGNSMPMSTALSIYLGIAGVALVGELVGGSILYDAKNIASEAIWEYNRSQILEK